MCRYPENRNIRKILKESEYPYSYYLSIIHKTVFRYNNTPYKYNTIKKVLLGNRNNNKIIASAINIIKNDNFLLKTAINSGIKIPK